MPIFDLFSKRQKRLRGEMPDVFEYDEIPKTLRVQIIHIWREIIGEYYRSSYANEIYKFIQESLCREYGVFNLGHLKNDNYQQDIEGFFLAPIENENVLDIIEFVFRIIDKLIRQDHSHSNHQIDEAISELNARFFEHSIGYQYESGMLIRKDSEFIHAEVVTSTLAFLQSEEYQGANEEFLKAHEHYRHGRYKECLNECLKAFESTMKAICDKRTWIYRQNDTAKKLVEICFSNELVPSFIQSEISALRSVLESGIPTTRNKLGGHGQGTQQTTVPAYIASYTLHMTASTILFLVEAEKNLP